MATDRPLNDEDSFNKATVQGHRSLARGPLATAARYEAGRIHVELDSGCAFEFPAAHSEGLASARAADLCNVEITAASLGLYWPKLNADLYVPSLLKGVLGNKQWMAQIGVIGGKATSRAKTASSRANGKLGGRPRTTKSVVT